VTFQLDDVAEAPTVFSIRATLHALPGDLTETYSRILAKVHKKNDINLGIIRNVLLWVAGARRPLVIDELEEAVGLSEEDTQLYDDRTAKHVRQKLVSLCCNLVIYNAEDRTVGFADHTVLQYLRDTTQRNVRVNESWSSRKLQLDLDKADTHIGKLCVTYLSFPDFESQLVKTANSTRIDSRTTDELSWRNVPLGSHIRRLVSWSTQSTSVSRDLPGASINLSFPVVA